MKKYLFLICYVAFINTANAQSVSYAQLHQLFKVLMTGEPTTVKTISMQLHAINPKWQLITKEPLYDGETKYYYWRAKETNSDSTAIAIYIDEDATTLKYTIKYAFHSKALYDSMLRSLTASSYYPSGSVTSFTDNSKGEFTTTALASNSLPMASRIDFILSDYNINAGPNPRLFTVDIFTRYIPKQ